MRPWGKRSALNKKDYQTVQGELTFRGDKSLSHRALFLAALADGASTIRNLSQGEDVRSTINCLRQCGIAISGDDPVDVHGNIWKEPDFPLNCGNSGTTARLLMGVLAGQGIAAALTGDESLKKRPMERVLKPLREIGIDVESQAGHLPAAIHGHPVRGIDYILPVASAQVKSALLFAGLGSPDTVTVHEPAPTRDHTERMMGALGLPIKKVGNSVTLQPAAIEIRPFNFTIPGDPSTAAFFAAAAALAPGSTLTLSHISTNPTRTQFFKYLQNLGAKLEWKEEGESLGEPFGTIVVQSGELKPFTLSGADIPGVIDEIPILAILASQANGFSAIRDAKELRVKESDRIEAIVTNLRNLGCKVEELEDGLTIHGGKRLRGGRIKTFGDHRIAMAFAIAGLVSEQPIELDDPDCVRISSPEFFDFLRQVTK